MTAAFWIDEDGTEYQIDSSRPGAPGWSVVHFVDEGMALSMVQNQHIVVRQQENAPDAVQGVEGKEPSNQEEGDSAMQSTDIVHGREEALEALAARSIKDQEDGFLVVLSVARSGPFRAEITQYARRAENGEIVFDELELTIDSSDQAGGQMFSDLTILDGQLDDFLTVVEQITAEYRAIVGQGSKSLRRDEDEIRAAADVRESM
ncbi:hypothetical protein MWU77_10550 [Rhodococcus sp. F64268]|uniref:hypothetical protein n=1 Tax=Rhodococcus sp. F64268 TaxID=2926402 RepID=UPI001FF4CD04|nr:hypothetical protein [Rhodococcus sp. F64268]MCK0091219.1 hypothetical protein [Rhodococcus sp. F64268]